MSLCTARRPDPRRPRCEEKRETQRPLRPACGPFRACRQLGDTVPAARTRPTPSVGHVKSSSSAVCTIRCKNLGTNLGTVGRAGGSRCRRRRGDGTRRPQLPAAQRLVPEHPGTRPGGDGGAPRTGCTGSCREGFPKRQRFLKFSDQEAQKCKEEGRLGEGTPRRFTRVKTRVSGRDGAPGGAWGGPSSHGAARRGSGPDSRQQKRKRLAAVPAWGTVARGGHAGALWGRGLGAGSVANTSVPGGQLLSLPGASFHL